MTIHSRRMPDGCKCLAGMMALVVLPVCGPESIAGINRPYHPNQDGCMDYAAPTESRSRPYLTVTASPALRVRAPAPPPAYDTEPAPAGPGYLDENNLPPAPPVAQERLESTPGATRQPTRQERPRRQDEEVPTILPDDLRKEVRPEDVMPFFLFPGAGANPTGVAVPVPAQAPAPTQIPSSATYRQQ